jgi:hypothetical protein
MAGSKVSSNSSLILLVEGIQISYKSGQKTRVNIKDEKK